ncbi:MAG: hypothetical protein IJ503_05015 [Akkermansia sp.]|nr:hypothetical protein [Akkermansia sp.]
MRLLSLVVLLSLSAPAAEPEGSITLDPAEMEDIKRSVFGGGALQPVSPQGADSIANEPSPMTEEQQQWLRAMSAEGDIQTILLLELMQRLNPGLPMNEYPRLYAEALVLHRSAADGEPIALANLESGLRSGVLPGGLAFMRSEYLVSHLRRMVEAHSH